MSALGRREDGAALLLGLLLLVLGGVAVLLSALSGNAIQRTRELQTEAALQQAKTALIGYAASYPEQHLVGGSSVYVPGHLPCPDDGTNVEGRAALNCGAKGISAIGRLPWRDLGLPPLKDADGNCLWYAVSGNLKASPKADLLNSDSVGQFRIVIEDGISAIAGAAPDTQAIAVIFSPGPPTSGQTRSNNGSECGGDYQAADFLDRLSDAVNNAILNNTPEATTTLAAHGPAGFNDRLTWITPNDLFQHGTDLRQDLDRALYDASYIPDSDYASDSGTTPALAQRIAECLAGGFAAKNNFKRLPWAAPVPLADTPPDTFSNAKLADNNGLLVGRVPFSVFRSVSAIATANFPLNFPNTLRSCTTANSTSCRLLRVDNCPLGWRRVAGSPTTTDSPDGWWDKWKDHYFYAVAPDFQPAGVLPTNCTAAKCLYVDGNGPFAAIVIFSDRRQAGQIRATTADKNNPANYLENENIAAIQNNNPADPGFGKFKRTGNDKFVCIKPDLTIDSTCS